MTPRSLPFLTASALLLVILPATAADLQEGLWDLSLSMTAAGGGQRIGPFSRTQCFTRADAQNPEKLFAEVGAECSYGDRHYQGNRFTFTIQCGGALPMSGSGSVEYASGHFEGEMLLNADVPGAGTLETRSQVSGHRIGDCKG